jgi:WhiB family redox-sensing transcriptional regulator
VTTEMKWASKAACVGNSELFFEDNRPTLVRKAKSFCSVCVVKSQCLTHAIENGELGIWGGMTANERRIYRLQKRNGTEVA